MSKNARRHYLISTCMALIALGIYYSYEYLQRKIGDKQESTIQSDGTQGIIKETPLPTKYTCQICGKEFTGNGFCQDANGDWRPCVDSDNTYPFICSSRCAGIKANNIKAAWEKVEDKINEIDNTSKDYLKEKGYTQGEIDQMRDPNQTDPDIKMPDLKEH